MDFCWHLKFQMVRLAIALLERSGWYRGYWGHWRTVFEYAQRRGLHILPVHYYSPIPNTDAIPESIWQGAKPPIGFDLNIEAAIVWLKKLVEKFGPECTFPRAQSKSIQQYHFDNPAYKAGDAEVLYDILRELKPKKLVEIGSGYSTLLICEAIRKNRKEGYQCEFTAIEPTLPNFLDPAPPEVTDFIRKPVQNVPLELFRSLGPGDLLFIDSSHVATAGSDVILEYLTILPQLAAGVVVHVHDVFLPYEYPARFFKESRFFWNEQYVLQAFLCLNSEFEVLLPMHAIWQSHEDEMLMLFPSLRKKDSTPSSFWMRRRNGTPHPGLEREVHP